MKADVEKVPHELKTSMEKEISLMREVLANMHEEEYVLSRQDQHGWNQVMQDRFILVQKLSELRQARAKSLNTTHFHLPSEKTEENQVQKRALPIWEEILCEIGYLLDQIMALVDKINMQQSRNQSLFEKSQKMPMGHPSLEAPYEQKEKKQKAIVATFPLKHP